MAEESREHIKEALALCLEKGLGRTEVIKRYDSLAEKYDKYAEVLGFKTDIQLAKTLFELFPINRDVIKILDLACGTGKPAQKLLEAEFCNIDGLDASEGMLAMARKKSIYTRLIEDFIDGDHQADIKDDTYDAVTIVGGFGENHIPSEAIFEIVRVVKPGGVIVIEGRLLHFETIDDYKINLKYYFQELVGAGRLEEELRESFVCADEDCRGIVFVYRVL